MSYKTDELRRSVEAMAQYVVIMTDSLLEGIDMVEAELMGKQEEVDELIDDSLTNDSNDGGDLEDVDVRDGLMGCLPRIESGLGGDCNSTEGIED